jgi:hypothetical protein
MTALGPAAQVLQLLAAAEPLYFSWFYRRARLFRQRPKPVPAAAVLDLTTRCPLACAFCFAAATEHSQRSLDLDQLQALEGELSGLPHLQIVGGEPLTHPQWPQIARLLAQHHQRIDVYTSGVSFPLEKSKQRAWIERMFGEAPGLFSLTVAVDRYHRDQLGPDHFDALIDALADLQQDQSFAHPQLRWNVTDSALHTTGYLTAETVRAVLAGLHPRLPPLWQLSLQNGDFDEVWQFNPVVRMGRAAGGDGERLRAEDALWDPEVVLSPDGAGNVRWLGLLPATWMTEVPTGLALGTTAAGEGLADQLWRKLVAPRLGLEADREIYFQNNALSGARVVSDRAVSDRAVSDRAVSDRAMSDLSDPRQLRRAALQRQVDRWPVEGDQRLSEAATRLWSICGEGGQEWDLGCDRRLRRLPAPLLRRYAAVWLGQRPEHAAGWLQELVQRGVTPWQGGSLPMFLGYLHRPGLLNDAPDEPVPLSQAPLDLGVDAPHLGDALLRPRLSPAPWVDAEGRLHLLLDGLGSVALGPHVSPDGLGEALQILWRSLAFFVPEPLMDAWTSQLQTAVESALAQPFWQQQRSQGWANAVRRSLKTAGVTHPKTIDAPSEIWKLLAGEAEPFARL